MSNSRKNNNKRERESTPPPEDHVFKKPAPVPDTPRGTAAAVVLQSMRNQTKTGKVQIDLPYDANKGGRLFVKTTDRCGFWKKTDVSGSEAKAVHPNIKVSLLRK